jgi:glucoamylase
MEGFASRGGLIPEQVWDEPDRSGHSRHFGQCAGAAMPLMWAHAEYIKLLRSIKDSQVFDRIPIVAERYLNKRGRTDLEVWKPTHRVGGMVAGKVLRIQTQAAFLLHWTSTEWGTSQDSVSVDAGLGTHFADIHVSSQQKASVRFTFFWTGAQRWEGRDYEVEVRA